MQSHLSSGYLLLWPLSTTGFELRWIWYISAIGIVCQMAMNLLLLRSEFRRRLEFQRVAA